MTLRLLGLAESDNVPAYVALQAINSALDRAGVVEPKQVEMTHELKPFEQLYGDVMAGGSRADYRRSIGHPDLEPESPAIADQDNTRPGGARVLASHPDGQPFIIDGELSSSEPNADGSDDRAGGVVDHQGDEAGRISLRNEPVALPAPQSGYLPTEDAMEQAANANRQYRSQLRRR